MLAAGHFPTAQSHDTGGAQNRPQLLWQTFLTSNIIAFVKECNGSILSLPTTELHGALERIIIGTTEQVVKQEVQFTKKLMIEQQSLSADGEV
jgi:hypothetical protein